MWMVQWILIYLPIIFSAKMIKNTRIMTILTRHDNQMINKKNLNWDNHLKVRRNLKMDRLCQFILVLGQLYRIIKSFFYKKISLMNFIKNILTNQEIEMLFTDHMTSIIARTFLLLFMIQISIKLGNSCQD